MLAIIQLLAYCVILQQNSLLVGNFFATKDTEFDTKDIRGEIFFYHKVATRIVSQKPYAAKHNFATEDVY